MTKSPALLAAMIMVCPALAIAQTERELDAHEHGVSELNIAIAGSQIAIELHAPGFDIVGFEYVPGSDADLAAVEDALALLADPSTILQFPEAAGCSIVETEVALLQEDDDHDDHDHDDHDDHDEEHDEHAHDDENDDHDEHEDEHDHDEEHDDHDEEHADHDEHDHEEHAEHDDHDHEEHAEGAVHSEFQADYLMTCTDIGAIDSVSLPFFENFETSQELEVVVFTTSGATSFEADGDNAVLDLSDAP